MKGRRHTDDTQGTMGRTVFLACLIAGLLTTGVAVVSRALTADLGPKVGDILVFRPGAQMPDDWEFTVASDASPTPCILRPVIMAAGGGSLVVEQRLENPRQFHVHWAGAHTSLSVTDCGSSAGLLVRGVDLKLLANVAAAGQ